MRLPRKTKKSLRKFFSNLILTEKELSRVRNIFPYQEWKASVKNRTGEWTLCVCRLRQMLFMRQSYRSFTKSIGNKLLKEFMISHGERWFLKKANNPEWIEIDPERISTGG